MRSTSLLATSGLSVHKKILAPVCLAVATATLFGCGAKPIIKNDMLVTKLPTVDISKPEAFFTQHKPINMQFGSFVELSEKGTLFKPVQRLQPNSAVIYLYREKSRWAEQEIIAPTFTLNAQPIHGLTSNQYYPIEVPAGNYRLAMRRPMPPNVQFQKGVVVDFKVEANATYFLKYAELKSVSAPDPSLGLLLARPIIQMPTQTALTEISNTRLKKVGYSFTLQSKD